MLYNVVDKYDEGDAGRLAQTFKTDPEAEQQSYRTPWQRDYDRILHSPSFRRLQGKTQLFPGLETDFFRSRLTHSVEVAQVGRSIVALLNATEPIFSAAPIKPEIVEAAALAHDLGHPPFGHNGEDVLDLLMREHGGFEGNAQTLRILTRIEKYQRANNTSAAAGADPRYGLNLTYRTLAAVLKYDHEIPGYRPDRTGTQKGYYATEKSIVQAIKRNVGPGARLKAGEFRTLECSIMDIADDIAYCCYDLEDALQSGFVTPLDFMTAHPITVEKIAEKTTAGMNKLQYTRDEARTSPDDVKRIIYGTFVGIFDALADLSLTSPTDWESFVPLVVGGYGAANRLALDDYRRNLFISDLVSNCIRGVEVAESPVRPHSLITVRLRTDVRRMVEIFKHFIYEKVTMQPRLRIAEFRGREIVEFIFNTVTGKDNTGGRPRPEFLPEHFREIWEMNRDDLPHQRRTVADFIASMSDVCAMEYYGRLTSETPQTIFKPLW